MLWIIGHLRNYSQKLLKPETKRLAASYTRESLGLSERKDYLLVNISVSASRYQEKAAGDD
jgi:hypothetical protein